MVTKRDTRIYLTIVEVIRLIAAAIAGYFGGTV